VREGGDRQPVRVGSANTGLFVGVRVGVGGRRRLPVVVVVVGSPRLDGVQLWHIFASGRPLTQPNPSCFTLHRASFIRRAFIYSFLRRV